MEAISRGGWKTSSLRILLVDDNPEFLESAARSLAAEPHVQIVGRARSGCEALEQVTRLQPDLVLMDWAMPEMDGLEATQRIKAQPGAPRVVMLTMHDDPAYRIAATEARADGFVCKSEFSEKLLPLIRTFYPQRIPLQLRLVAWLAEQVV